MIMANPQHEALHTVGVHPGTDHADMASLVQAASQLRQLVAWARRTGLPENPDQWTLVDLRRRVTEMLEAGKSATTHVALLKRMAILRPAISAGRPAGDPWEGRSARHVANCPGRDELSTKAVRPEIWFPLIRAAWSYIHTFAPDILNAVRAYEGLCRAASRSIAGKQEQVDAWLTNPANKIPVYPTKSLTDGSPRVNWRLLDLRVGLLGRHGAEKPGQKHDYTLAHSRPRRARAIDVVAEGRFTSEGLVPELRQVTRADGTTGPWHPGIQPQDLFILNVMLRNAAFVLVAALSAMRDSELHSITRGSVVEYYNSPAIASTLQKGNANLPRKHWWIAEPAAEAIVVAEAVSVHAERVFAPLRSHVADAVDGPHMITTFINFANAGRDWSGLDVIPPGPAKPHMFRRTMAMLTDQFPGSEIALGMQLKHFATRALANRATQGYAASDTAWADHLESATDSARFRGIKDLYGIHKAGKSIGFGPGAERVSEAFNEVQAEVAARGGDAQVEESLLRKARITIRFGTLNNCLFDASNPAGAVCLENAIVPPGHTGPLEERCRPDRCHNSMIGVEHVAIYDSHRRNQLKLLETPRLPPVRKALITRELDRVEAVLKNVSEESS